MVKKCETCGGAGTVTTYPLCETCGNHRIVHFWVPGYGPAIKRCPDCEPTDGWREAHKTVETCQTCQGLGWVH